MTVQDYIAEICLRLTGNVLELELSDATLTQALKISLRELQRYYSVTEFITVPYQKCIDTSEYNMDSVSHVYKVSNAGSSSAMSSGDPWAASIYQMYSGVGPNRYYQNYVDNYLAYSTLQRTRNTLSTDLAHVFDKRTEKLYINTSTETPKEVTIEYVPILKSVEDIISNYWIDILIKLATANTKILVGRIRTRYKESNAIWQQDGDQILNEGISEYKEICEFLQKNEMLAYPID